MVFARSTKPWKQSVLHAKVSRDRNLLAYEDEITQAFLPTLRFKKGDYVMDLGCGHGRAISWLVEEVGQKGRVVGVDLDSRSLRSVCSQLNGRTEGLLRKLETEDFNAVYLPPKKGVDEDSIVKREKKEGKRFVILYHTNAEGLLRCPDNYFDKVLSMYVFAYIPDKVKALQEALRVLKRGGRAYMGWTGHVVVLNERPSRRVVREMQKTFHNWVSDVDDAYQIGTVNCLETRNIDYTSYTLPEFASKYLKRVKVTGSEKQPEKFEGYGLIEKQGKVVWKRRGKALELADFLYSDAGLTMPLYIEK